MKKTPSEVSRTHITYTIRPHLIPTHNIHLFGYLYAFFIKHFPWHFTLLIFYFSATGWFYGFDKPTLRSMTVFEVGNNTGSTSSGKMMGKPLGWYPYSWYIYIYIYSGYLLGISAFKGLLGGPQTAFGALHPQIYHNLPENDSWKRMA